MSIITSTSLGDVNAWKSKARPLLDGGQGKIYPSDMPQNDMSHERHSVAAAPPHHYNLPCTIPGTVGTTSTALSDGGKNPSALNTTTKPSRTMEESGNDTNAPPPRHDYSHGLRPPTLKSSEEVTGESTPKLRTENKRNRRQRQCHQPHPVWWTTYKGTYKLPPLHEPPRSYRNQMCPRGLALHHPAATTLLEYATAGCPVNTGNTWTTQEMQAAIERGPHVSALLPEAMAQLDDDINEKVLNGQARLVRWNDIRLNPPPQLKISPVAMVPHNSRPFRAILDLSFPVKLRPSGEVPSVNSTTVKTAPKGAIDQIGHVLPRIIHAFATTEPNAKIFMAKWDIKDGFWRLDCKQGEEWNFAYVQPSSFGTNDIRLVVPTSLQMGWMGCSFTVRRTPDRGLGPTSFPPTHTTT